MFETRFGRQMMSQEGGEEGVDNDFLVRGFENIGAWIMGRNMFGPIRGPWGDEDWKGWWGDNPPYHCSVFVLTHHPHPPITMEGGTIFHFVDDDLATVRERALDAADGADVRIGGGATRSSSSCAPASSTTCTFRSRRCSWAVASGSSTTSRASPTPTNVPSSSRRRGSCTSRFAPKTA